MGFITSALGFKKPDRRELLRNLAGFISHNATKSEEHFLADRSRLDRVEGDTAGVPKLISSAYTAAVRDAQAYTDGEVGKDRTRLGGVDTALSVIRAGLNDLRAMVSLLGSSAIAEVPAIVVEQSSAVNHTSDVQAALNIARDAGGGEVVVPYTGQDWCIGKLTIYKNTTLRCAPGVVMKRSGDTYGLTNYTDANGPTDPTDPYSNDSNISVIGGTWDGNIASEPYLNTGFVVFYFAAARNISITGVTIKDTVTNHCIDANGVAGLTVRDSKFLGYRDATKPGEPLYPRNYSEAIQCSQFNDSAKPAFHGSVGAPSVDVIVQGCTFGASGTPGTQAYPVGFGTHTASNDKRSSNIQITGNTFNGCTYAAIRHWTYDDLKIIGNTFTGCATGVMGNNFTNGRTWNVATKTFTAGQATRVETTGCVITDNYFVDTVATDIQLVGTNNDVNGFWATMNDITVARNIFKATTSAMRSGHNIRLFLCKDGIVAENQGGMAVEGILSDSGVNIGILNNKVAGTTSYGIRVLKTTATPKNGAATYSVNNRIINNHVEKAGTHGIGAIALYFATVVGNTVMDWGQTTLTSSGILVSGTDGALVSGNNILHGTAGAGAGIALAGSTNIAVTPDNRVVKPDGVKVSVAGAGSTYGPIQYV
ncbi:hypothetical protein ACX80U_11985 [Arthrobacter sp. TmT3-37]